MLDGERVQGHRPLSLCWERCAPFAARGSHFESPCLSSFDVAVCPLVAETRVRKIADSDALRFSKMLKKTAIVSGRGLQHEFRGCGGFPREHDCGSLLAPEGRPLLVHCPRRS